MRHLLLFIVIGINISCFSQVDRFEYSYDAAGNRYHREVFYLIKSEVVDSSSFVDNKDPEDNEFIYTTDINNKRISIYPNPTKGILFIEGDELENVMIFNANGQIIRQEKFSGNKKIIDLSKEPEGVYFMRIYAGNDSKEYKIVKK
jgi:hypothetical protein